MRKRKLKIVLVGAGRIGNRHAEHISRLAELIAVCDIDENKAKDLGKKYSCVYFNEISDLYENVKDIDLVAVCTPNYLHAEHSIYFLKKGINVLCEKPMALTVAECEKMIVAAERSNSRIFVVKQNRFNPPLIELQNIISSDKLGKIFNVQLNCFWNRNNEYYLSSDWKGKLEFDGGTLFTQFSHFIDLLFWLIGDIDEVYSFADNFIHSKIIEFEDTGVAIVKFDSGCIGTINYTVNSYCKNFEGSITIFGEKGTIKIGGQYLNKIEYCVIEDYLLPKLPDSKPANDYGTYQGSMSNHDKVYENVIDVLLNGSCINTNFLDGLKTVQIIQKIYKSQKKNE